MRCVGLWDQIQNLQNCLITPRRKFRREGRKSQTNEHLPQSPFPVYFKEEEIFFIAFYESYLSTAATMYYHLLMVAYSTIYITYPQTYVFVYYALCILHTANIIFYL
jgi:hypothetical protein